MVPKSIPTAGPEVFDKIGALIKESISRSSDFIILDPKQIELFIKQGHGKNLKEILSEYEDEGYIVGINGKKIKISWAEGTNPEDAVESFLNEVKDDKKQSAMDQLVKNHSRYRDQMIYGVLESTGKIVSKSPLQNPGTLFFGGMGTGKSQSMIHTLTMRLLTDSDHDLHLLMNSSNCMDAMSDFLFLSKKYENNVLDLNSVQQSLAAINCVHNEIVLRLKEFNALEVGDYLDYEKKTGKKLTRIFMWIEKFDQFLQSSEISYSSISDQEGSVAWTFLNLLKNGRRCGVFLNLSSNRASSESVPTSTKVGISTFFGFRVNNPGDAAAANLPQAADIPSSRRGTCATEDGLMSFPFHDNAEVLEILDGKVKPIDSEFLGKNIQEILKKTD